MDPHALVRRRAGRGGAACAQAPSTGSTGAADGICNEQLPNDSVYNRFLYVVRALAANGFYVLIDDHLSFDATAATNPAQWVAYWVQLLRDIVADPVSAGRVMVDLLNEPDARGLRRAAPLAQPRLPVSARGKRRMLVGSLHME